MSTDYSQLKPLLGQEKPKWYRRKWVIGLFAISLISTFFDLDDSSTGSQSAVSSQRIERPSLPPRPPNPLTAPEKFSPPGLDEALDELWVACVRGELAQCDALFSLASAESKYEEFGASCGLRRTVGLGLIPCVDSPAVASFQATRGPSQMPPPGIDAALDRLWVTCRSGNLVSCDNLYMDSPFESEYEEFGASCGERRKDRSGAAFCVDDPTLPTAQANVPQATRTPPETRPPEQSDVFLIMQITWEGISPQNREVLCREVRKGMREAVAVGSQIAASSGGVVTGNEAAAFLRVAC